jgi:RNA polymerase sigma factor (sigma-70 family)
MESKDPLLEYLETRDHEHFVVCICKLRRRLVRTAASVLRDRSRAEDVAQDIFLRLLDPAWEPKGMRLGVPFLLVAARKLAEVRLRSEARRRARELATEEERSALRAKGHSREEAPDVEEAVEALPEPMKLCVKHRYYYGLTVKEIVKVTGFSRHKVYDLFAQASERLRARLGDSAGAFLLPGLLGLTGVPASGAPASEGFEGQPRKLSRREPAHARARNGAARRRFHGLALVLSAGAAPVRLPGRQVDGALKNCHGLSVQQRPK